MTSEDDEQVLPPCPDCLHDTTRKVLPGAFVILFVITGTYVLIYSLSLHEPVPSNFVAGAAITFGIIIALVAAGNFLLYARKQMSLIRLSPSGSGRSSRAEREREAWYPKLKIFFVDCENQPRRLLRELALRRALKKSSRKGSVNTANQTPNVTNPSNRPCSEIDLERGEHPGQKIACGDMNTTVVGLPEAKRIRSMPTASSSAKNHTKISHAPKDQRHDVASSSRVARISTVSRSELLSDTGQEVSQGRLPRAETMNASAMQIRISRSGLPEKGLKEQALSSTKCIGYGARRSSHGDKIRPVDPPIRLEERATEHHPICKVRRRERSSNIQVYHLELPQEQSMYSNSKTSYINGTLNNGDSAINFDEVKPCLQDSQATCYLKRYRIITGFDNHETSKISQRAASTEQCGNSMNPGTMVGRTSNVYLAHTTDTDDHNSFRIPMNTNYQAPSTHSLSSTEVSPQIPAYSISDSLSLASKFTSQFLEGLNGKFDDDDERFEPDYAITVPSCELSNE